MKIDKLFIENILTKNGFDTNVLEKYSESHRYYHNLNHILNMIKDIYNDIDLIDPKILNKLIIATIFHDAIYNMSSKTNEEDSVQYMLNDIIAQRLSDQDIMDITLAILETKMHNPTTMLSERLTYYDMNILNKDFSTLLEYENGIFKEYSHINWSLYKSKRIEFLSQFRNSNIDSLIKFIENRKPKIGVYAGSFNPATIAHKHIIVKSETVFDKVIVAKGRNSTKNIDETEFNTEFENLKTGLPYNEVITYDGLLTDLIQSLEGDITLIRGIRNGHDLEAENNLITFMKDMYSELKVVYIPCDKQYEHISSTAIRNIRKYGEDKIKNYLL